jgi:hypothetical protein
MNREIGRERSNLPGMAAAVAAGRTQKREGQGCAKQAKTLAPS